MKKSFIILLSTILVLVLLVIAYNIALLPTKSSDKNIVCEYNGVAHKIVCTQTGDIIPEWYSENSLFSGSYQMQFLFKKSETDYIALNMSDKVLVKGLARKFIYYIEDKNVFDFIKFKQYVSNAEQSNWGSVILYCSDDYLEEDVCKDMKNAYNRKNRW